MALKDFWKKSGTQAGKGSGSGSAPEGSGSDPAKIANRLGTVLIPVLLILILVRALTGCFYILSETESAVVGSPAKAVVEAGWRSIAGSKAWS